TISRLHWRTPAMSTATEPVTTPNRAAWCSKSATFALQISFLLGRQAMFGQEPPTQRRSTTAARRPERARGQDSSLPPAPLPSTRSSYGSGCDMFISLDGPQKSGSPVWLRKWPRAPAGGRARSVFVWNVVGFRSDGHRDFTERLVRLLVAVRLTSSAGRVSKQPRCRGSAVRPGGLRRPGRAAEDSPRARFGAPQAVSGCVAGRDGGRGPGR